MPTKPATLPRWATDLTNNDAPSSGQMDTGWTPGQTGVSDYDNYIKYWTYKWVEWLNGITGTSGIVHVDSGGNLVSSATLPFTPTAPNWKWTTTRERTCPFTNGDGVWIPTAASTYMLPIQVESGEIVQSWNIACRKESTSGTTMSASLVRVSDEVGTTTTIGTTQNNSANGPVNISLGQSSHADLPHTIVAGNVYYFMLQVSGTVASLENFFRKPFVNVTRNA